MSLRSTALVALALTLSACGGDDVAEPATDSSTVTDAIRTPSAAPADSSDDMGSTAPADADDDVSGSPKDDGGAASGKPGGGSAPPPPPASGGKPSAGSSAPSGGPGVQRHSGTLADGDDTLDSGEYADEYSVEVRAGQTITVDMTSDDFDAYLILRPPSDEQVDNDDGEDGTNAHITHRATESGTYRVLPTSYESGESGAYRVSIQVR